MASEIVVIGVHHYDPFGPEKIRRLLQMQKRDRNFIPDCIAVESSKEIYDGIISKRVEFRKLAKSTFSALSESDLDILYRMIGHEADSHQTLYPNLPIAWLDEGRMSEAIQRTIQDYANGTMRMLKHYLTGRSLNTVTLKDISQRAWSGVNVTSLPEFFDRDDAFFDITCKAMGDYQRIVAVVGAQHANLSNQGVYANLLQRSGHSVTAYITQDL